MDIFLNKFSYNAVTGLHRASAMAQFEIKLSVGADEDVSHADGNQVEYGAATTINIMSTKVIHHDATATPGSASQPPKPAPLLMK